MPDEKTSEKAGSDPFGLSAVKFDQLSDNAGKLAEISRKLSTTYLKPENVGANPVVAGELQEAVKTLGQLAQSILAHPEKALEAQQRLTKGYIDLWVDAGRRMQGDAVAPGQAVDKAPRDKRFADSEWSSNPFFDFLRRAYLHTAEWAQSLTAAADDLDPHTRHKAEFYIRQIMSALSPSNYVVTNPELLRLTLKESGANLVRGLAMFAEDLERGKGMLKIRQSDGSKFEVGVNLAATPGKVVFRNHLIELIQYAPTTAEVLARPLLIVPPWINKFYILDLNPDKSFIRWCVDEGHTVFTISWVNPDERHRDCGFESYMRDGVFAAIDAIRNQTGETRVNALGYCVGGTLLASTLGYMAATRDSRIAAATFLTTQVDFSNSGDLQVFADEEQIAAVEAEMAEKGYLEGGKMAMAFNMLRPNDLIWSYMVSNYVKGAEPHAFDLLYWNSDSTNMPAKNHSFYMRQCYLHDNIVKGKMVLDGKRINLSKVKTPIYNLAAREDHIAPAASVFKGCRAFGSKVDYVLAGSGHIAGVVNPPAAGKYQYWTGGKAEGELKDWLAAATEHPGSWWPHWSNWLRRQAPSLAKARNPDKGKLKPLGDAPGEFVKKLS